MNADISLLKEKYLFPDESSVEVVTKARELVSSGFAKNLTEAAGMLAAKMPGTISPKSTGISGVDISNNSLDFYGNSDFENGFKNNKPRVWE